MDLFIRLAAAATAVLFLSHCTPQRYHFGMTDDAINTIEDSRNSTSGGGDLDDDIIRDGNDTNDEDNDRDINDPQVQRIYEAFEQGPVNKKVDILFITDNSDSMYEDQRKLGKKFKTFIQSLKDADWRIGITTTDVSSNWRASGNRGTLLELEDTRGEYILDKNSEHAQKKFALTIALKDPYGRAPCTDPPFCGSINEQPLRAMIMAMDKHLDANRDLFRLDANLAVIVLSDEDEMSEGPPQATKPEDVIAQYRNIFGDDTHLSVYGIIVVPDDKDCRNKQSGVFGWQKAEYAYHVQELSRLTGGKTGSICDKSYDTNVWNIGANIHQLLSSVQLQATPKRGSLKVKFSPQQNIGWQLQGNKLVFNKPLKEGTMIEVSYLSR